MKKKYGSLINGKWIKHKKSFVVQNPYDSSKLADVFDAEADGTLNAIKSANRAFLSWKKTSAEERSKHLKRFHSLVIENKKLLAKTITMECGKPLSESLVEVEYGASFIDWSANQILRSCGKIFESPESSKKMFYIKEPIGVVAAITPWNFPLAMVTRKVCAAIAAGCTVILKPSELTPLTALILGELSLKAKFPKGVFNIINGEPKVIGEILCKNSNVKKITFTGSTRVGKLLMRNSSDTVKNISLELGGNAPFIVFEDADLSEALEGLINAKFRNAGQTCISANRIFIHKKISENFLSLIVKKLKRLKVGNGLLNSDLGPLISKEALSKVNNHILDAKKKGGLIKFGGKLLKPNSLLFQPTLITNVKKDMDIFQKENFSPIVPIILFENDSEVVDLANDTNYGLAAYFFTKNSKRVWETVNNLEFGMFGINSGKISSYLNPFGGLNESGIGREGSFQCLEPFLETKFVSWNL